MLNKRKETMPWVYMSICVIVILLGIILIVKAFSETRRELVSEHNEHLLDIAWSTDRNIANMLDRCQEELEYTVDRCHNDATIYSHIGDVSLLTAHLRKIPSMESSYISRLLFMDGETVIAQVSNQGDYLGFDFPHGIVDDGIFFCADENEEYYLAVAKYDAELKLRYVMLVDLQRFYDVALGNELGRNYWMGLYSAEAELMLQNDPNYPLVREIVPEEVVERSNGTAMVVSSELTGKIITKGYVFEDTAEDTTEERLVAAIPTNLGHNGTFAVGISVESSQYFGVIHNLIWRIVAYALLILLAVCVMMSLLYRHRRRNDEIREQIGLLEEQNRSMQELVDKTKELAHHQRLEMIGTMTSSIAHEFNNLLTPIMGYSLMTMEAMPEGCEELFDNVAEIYEASFRAKTLVSRLSGLSRKNSDATSRLLSPDTILTKVRDVAQPSVPRMVTVKQELNCPGECLYGDETQLCQLALNLIINAFQAMEEKGGSLTISTALEGDEVVMRFADTGPGMTREVVEHIFEPFYTTKDVSRGTGLGLAIVKQTVESHHGTIAVDSEVGRGTTFTVRFPRHIEDKPQ